MGRQLRVVACDPGCLGALALLDSGALVDVVDMPVLSVRRGKSDKREVDGHELAALLRRWAAGVGVIEQVGGIQGQAAGAVEYTMVTLGMRLVRVAPITWKKRLGIRGGKDDSRAAAMRLWPGLAGQFKRVKDDGRAEASLIGHWHYLTSDMRENTGASNDVFA